MEIKNIIIIFAAIKCEIMKKIISWIAIDGLLHLLVSVLIMIVGFAFINFWAIIPTIIIGIGKEVYDMRVKQGYTWEMVWHDIICDFIGIVGGILISLIIF